MKGLWFVGFCLGFWFVYLVWLVGSEFFCFSLTGYNVLRSQNCTRLRENILFFLTKFKQSLVKSCSSMSLDCGYSPLWVWYVGKCQTSERASLHTVCLCETCCSWA